MGEWALALAYLAAGLGAGLTTIGAGMGIGRLAASAMDGTARQPEAGNAIRITMIIAAAMIEQESNLIETSSADSNSEQESK